MTANDDGMIERSVQFTLARSDGDGQTLEGYAAVFNSPTRIDSWEGVFDEVIAPGAFAHTIRNGTPALMFEHGKHPLYGSMPIGSITKLKEDARGLFVSARLFENWMIEPLRDAIRSQAIDGMSFRFSVPPGKDEIDHSGDVPLRTIHEVKLYELGPVVFPAYADTTVALRCLDEVRSTIGSPEQPAEEAVATDPPSDDPGDQSSRERRLKWWKNRSAPFEEYLAQHSERSTE
jgi:HK97 family phage prohead protease